MKDGTMEEFQSTLRRERKPQTPAMLDGIRFENLVQSVCEGQELDSGHEWYKPVRQISSIVRGGQYQVKAYRDLTVDGVTFVCYGILDFLKSGIIYDTKFSKTYKVGKYLDSPQHPMYFYLCPEAREFQYLISDGKWIYREVYRPDEAQPIEKTIRAFMNWLDKTNNVQLFCDNWRSKYD
jgi:hypothetical protein